MTDVEIFGALNMMSGLMHLWLAQAVILRCTAPARLCEIGVGTGDWAIGAATVSGATEVTLIEDFSLAQEDRSLSYFWPSTPDELLDHCQQTSRTLGGNAIYHVIDRLPVAGMFDTIRLDCFPEIDQAREGIAWIVDHLSPNGIVYVDDLTCTTVPNRMLATIEQMQAKVLKPFWFAGNEGGFCRYKYDCAWIQDCLLAGQDSSYRARRQTFDDLPIVQTKQPSVWKESFAWD